MTDDYQLTPRALWHIQRLSPEGKNLLASTLGRVGYAAGTNIRDNWKAEIISHEAAVAIIAQVTGLSECKIVEKIKVNPLKVADILITVKTLLCQPILISSEPRTKPSY